MPRSGPWCAQYSSGPRTNGRTTSGIPNSRAWSHRPHCRFSVHASSTAASTGPPPEALPGGTGGAAGAVSSKRTYRGGGDGGEKSVWSAYSVWHVRACAAPSPEYTLSSSAPCATSRAFRCGSPMRSRRSSGTMVATRCWYVSKDTSSVEPVTASV